MLDRGFSRVYNFIQRPIMKVLLFNGSIHKDGTTSAALKIVADAIIKNGVEAEILQIGAAPVSDCLACGKCAELGRCVINDVVNEWAEKARDADGFVFGSPVYYAHPDGRILSAMDRLFYSAGRFLAHKPGAVITAARRAGNTASLDVLAKHLTINQMPVISSTYWNMVFGAKKEDVLADKEGVQTMETLGANMAWLIKCIKAGENAGITPPQTSAKIKTNFVR